MATLIEQQPLYTSTTGQVAVGADVIFAVSNNNIVATETKVKFIAEVHISRGLPPNLNTSNNLAGTFKTTPNNAGIGIFNFSNIVENYVKADNMAALGSSYKGTETDIDNHHPIHLIDKFSLNMNSIRYLAIQFRIEYLGATNCAGDQNNDIVREACGEEVNSTTFTLMNGYVKETDILTKQGDNFGYDLNEFIITVSSDKFLSNAPTARYAAKEDYGTIAYLAGDSSLTSIEVDINHAGGIANLSFPRTLNNGAYNGWSANTDKNLVYFGCYPGNLRENYDFNFYLDTMTSYEIYGLLSTGASVPGPTINIQCPDLKGYAPIRLAWLNQWGVWDYYTFNKKSVKSLSTKGTTYNQLAGTWNESAYRLDSYKGGKKSFRVNATETIKMNTDFVNEDHNTMFEELMNSPEVYILDGFQTDAAYSALNQYVTPVRLVSKSFTTKTVANDKLIQYTFEVEKTKTLRTQSV
jgi:hypothetical protein|tara:strand:- start:6900 stop:8300 length:1401 start_codon:yes stop_codon:yes gene_type:complete